MKSSFRLAFVTLGVASASACIAASYTDVENDRVASARQPMSGSSIDNYKYHNIEVTEVLPGDVTPPPGWGEMSENDREGAEHEVEACEAPERAAEAAAETAEEGEEQNEADEGALSDRIESVILEARINIIYARNAASDPDVCAYDIVSGPGLENQLVHLKFTQRNGPTQTLDRVSNPDACTSTGGWYYDDPTAPTRMVMCPASCDWARESQGANVEIILERP